MEWIWFLLRENLHFALASLFLVLGLVTDILWKKVPNVLFLCMTAGAFLFCFVEGGFVWGVLLKSLSLFLLAFVLGFVFFLFRILGAGDVKLFMAIAPLGSYSLLFYTFVYSFVWGGVLGIFYIISWGRWRLFLRNLKCIYEKFVFELGFILKKYPSGFASKQVSRPLKRGATTEESLNYVPFTVAIFLAYLSCIGIYY